MENIINIETLPKRKEGIDWGKSVGCELCFSYNSHDGKLTIKKYDKKHQNVVVEVCDLYNKGFSTKEIENVLKLSKATVCRYLNSGTQMNICNYIGSDAATKHCKKSFTIEYEGNEYKFNSIVELYNQCNDLFGFQIGRAKLGYCVENDLIYKNIKFRKD